MQDNLNLDQKLTILIDFQNLLFSSDSNQTSIESFITQHKNDLSQAEIDHQLVLALSLNYDKISILAPLLSKPEIKTGDILHFDQTLIFLLLQANIRFPIDFFISQFKFRYINSYHFTLTLQTILYLEKESKNILDMYKIIIKLLYKYI